MKEDLTTVEYIAVISNEVDGYYPLTVHIPREHVGIPYNLSDDIIMDLANKIIAETGKSERVHSLQFDGIQDKGTKAVYQVYLEQPE